MEISQLNSKQRKRLQAILLKEDFRRLVSGSGNAERYIIDTVGYSAVPNVVACFGQGDCWKVYETDDRSRVLGEVKFPSALPAYQEAAARWGLIFQPSDITKGITSPHSPWIDAAALRRAILHALNNARKIALLLDGEESGRAAASDTLFLENVLSKTASPVRPHSETPGNRRRTTRAAHTLRVLPEELKKEKKSKDFLENDFF